MSWKGPSETRASLLNWHAAVKLRLVFKYRLCLSTMYGRKTYWEGDKVTFVIEHFRLLHIARLDAWHFVLNRVQGELPSLSFKNYPKFLFKYRIMGSR